MNIDEYRDGFHIRSIRPIDKEPFMELRKSISIIGEAYNEVPEFLESDWIRLLESTEDHHMVVYDNNDSRFVASCSFQDVFDNVTGKESDTIELGLNVIDDLRGQRIGTRIMHELINLGHKHFPDRELNVCVRKDNIPSIRVVEKNGGILIEQKMTPEAFIIKKALDESNTWIPKPEECDIRCMQDAVREGSDAVLIYKV